MNNKHILKNISFLFLVVLTIPLSLFSNPTPLKLTNELFCYALYNLGKESDFAELTRKKIVLKEKIQGLPKEEIISLLTPLELSYGLSPIKIDALSQMLKANFYDMIDLLLKKEIVITKEQFLTAMPSFLNFDEVTSSEQTFIQRFNILQTLSKNYIFSYEELGQFYVAADLRNYTNLAKVIGACIYDLDDNISAPLMPEKIVEIPKKRKAVAPEITDLSSLPDFINFLPENVKRAREFRKFLENQSQRVTPTIAPVETLSLGTFLPYPSQKDKHGLKKTIKPGLQKAIDAICLNKHLREGESRATKGVIAHIAGLKNFSSEDKVTLAQAALQSGFDPNKLSPNNESALEIAFESNNYSLFKLLLKHGANPFLANKKSYSIVQRLRDPLNEQEVIFQGILIEHLEKKCPTIAPTIQSNTTTTSQYNFGKTDY